MKSSSSSSACAASESSTCTVKRRFPTGTTMKKRGCYTGSGIENVTITPVMPLRGGCER